MIAIILFLLRVEPLNAHRGVLAIEAPRDGAKRVGLGLI